MKIRTIVFALLTAFLSAAMAAEGADAADACADCHGDDGVAPKAGVPHLNGQLLGALEGGIEKFRNGSRPGKAFGHDPAGLDSARMTEILKRYSASKAVRPKQANINPALVTRGDAVYLNRCADCHPDNGRESDKEAPLMAAQDMEYMVKQIGYFVEGKRKFAFKMDDAFRGLSMDDLTAVAHFFASQDQEVAKKKKRR